MKISEIFLHKSEIMFCAWERGKLLSVKFCRFGDSRAYACTRISNHVEVEATFRRLSRVRVYAHYSDFARFAFTTFTENVVTYCLPVNNTCVSDNN